MAHRHRIRNQAPVKNTARCHRGYTHRPPILAPPVRELLASSRLPHTRDQTMPHPVRNISWGHNVILIQCLTDPAVGDLLRQLGAAGEIARDLACRLYNIRKQKKWPSEARACNSPGIAWPETSKVARSTPAAPQTQEEIFK